MKIKYLLIAAALILSTVSSPAQDDWVSLFNGKNLRGWQQLNGKAKYKAKDGILVGTTVLKSPNSFLCTKNEYSSRKTNWRNS